MEIDLLKYAADMQCQELHMSIDEETGLKAIIAIHNMALGPALGGCRFLEYASTNKAAVDVIRLAQAMTYKAAISKLPLGGGKMVILRPKVMQDKAAFFKAVGRFVENLNGRYITAVDSGTSTHDMDIIATETRLMNRGILYAPDYVINAGGLIYVAAQKKLLQKTRVQPGMHTQSTKDPEPETEKEPPRKPRL